jgi:hypothetical protein
VVRVSLTKEAVLAMEAGAELDALVAERVMGWKRGGANDHTRPAHRPSKDFPGTVLGDFGGKGPHDYLESPGPAGRIYFCGCPSSADLPAYSTSIADAWEVVEKLRIAVAFLKHYNYETRTYESAWWAKPLIADGEEEGHTDSEIWFEEGDEASAATAPLAIARAALLTTL